MTAPIIFPGFPEPTDLKWRRNRADECRISALPGFERERQIYDSPIDGLRAIVAWDEREGYHLSISHPSRYPTWTEIRDARYALLPDACTMGMLLPPQAEYVNLHPNCFHLHQVADA